MIVVGVVGLVVIIGVLVVALRPSSPDAATGPAPTVDDRTSVPAAPISPTDSVAMGAAVDALCAGTSTSIPGAAAYPAGTGAPHLTSFERSDERDGSVSARPEWSAGSFANADRPVELVLCSSFERLPGVTSCGGYAGVRIDVQDATWTLELRSAANGAVLATTTAPGTSGCPEGFVAVPDRPETRPRKPEQAVVDAFLEPFVMAPSA